MDHMAIVATHTAGRNAILWMGKPVETNGVEVAGITAKKPTKAPNVSAHHTRTLRVEDGATQNMEDGIIVNPREWKYEADGDTNSERTVVFNVFVMVVCDW